MAKDKNGTVVLQLDRPRELRLGNKALKRYSALAGCTVDQIPQAIARYDNLVGLVYVMLAVDAERVGETLTVEQVDTLLDEHVTIQQLTEAVTAAITAAFGAGDGQDASDPPQAAGTGTRP